MDKYKMAIIYPLVLWLFFKTVALLFGFTAYPDISKELFLDDQSPFLPMLIGLWIAAASYANGSGLSKTIRNAIVVSFIIAGIDVIFLLVLVNNSPTFLAYASSVYARSLQVVPSLMNLALAIGMIGIFVSTTASIAGYLLIDALRKKPTK